MYFRRKKKFIDPKFQASFALWLLLYSMSFFLLVLVVLFLEPIASWMAPASIDYRFVMTDFFALLMAKWPFLIVVVAIIVISGNFFSHRIIGPEFRFKQVLRSLKERDLNPFLKLRKYDYLKGLEASFKGFISSHRETIAKLKDDAKEAKASLDSGSTEKAKEAISKVVAELEKYKTE